MPEPITFWLPAPRFKWREQRRDRKARHPAPKGNNQLVIQVPIPGKPGKTRNAIMPAPRVQAAEAAFIRALQRLPQCPVEPLTGDVRLEVDAVYIVPRTWEPWRRTAALEGTVRPTMPGYGFADLSGLGKMIDDAFERSGYIENDALIAEVGRRKIFGPEPGYRCKLFELPRGPQNLIEAQGATQGSLF